MKKLLALILVLLILLCGCGGAQTAKDNSASSFVSSSDESSKPISSQEVHESSKPNSVGSNQKPADSGSIPAYSGSPFAVLNGNTPNFDTAVLSLTAYENYSALDSLGRCGAATAVCGREIMPAAGEERGSISSVKPSGWIQAKYDGVSGGYLWNRCHLIGWQLSAENANKRNIITGTRYMNVEGMLPFENMVADYIEETGNHVAYRITPIYSGQNLVCSGVQMEAYSIEDEGEGICFNVYCYNVQPGITINYATGASSSASVSSKAPASSEKPAVSSNPAPEEPQENMVWKSKTGSKYHSKASCSNMKNPTEITKSHAVSIGLSPCSKCW